jgi:hypothetical protein
MFNLENIKGFTDRTDKMYRLYRSIYLSFFGDGAGAVFEPNEGLGLQDEYLSDGVGRDFKIDAGGSLHPLLLKRWKRTDITSFKTENCF